MIVTEGNRPMRRTIRFAILAMMLSALGACTQSQIRAKHDDPARDYAFDTISATTAVAAGPAGLTALDVFLARNGAVHGDRLVVAAPAEVLDRLRARYASAGIRVLPAPDARTISVDGPYRVTHSRLVVTPPACGDWSDAAAHRDDNQPAPNWGCATRSNLARMVADPHDLRAGRSGLGGIDTAADASAIRAYRAGLIEVVTVEGETATTGD